MGLFDYKYLNEEQIKGFEKYKYCSVDTSPLSKYISHPFWNWVVQFYPLWLAPNVITLAGSGFVTFAFLVVSYFDYYMEANSTVLAKGAIPNWVWLLCSICTFLGHTLDGTDGKQARRTGASGPVVDHGLDSWATVPFTVTIFSIFGQGEFSLPPIRLLLVLISVQVVFIVSHWEKYNTGILYLSWGYDFSQISLTLFYLFAYFKGYEYFKYYVYNGFTIAVCFEFGFYVCCYISLAVSARNIYLSYAVYHTGKQDNLFEVLLPLLPSSFLFITSVLWSMYSPGKIIDRDPRLFFCTMGVVFSNISCRLIIAQMSNTRVEIITSTLAAYIAASVISILGFLSAYEELMLLRLIAFVLFLAHIYYGICVVRQLCDHFKVCALSLRYLEKP